jgi:hypothetical protein
LSACSVVADSVRQVVPARNVHIDYLHSVTRDTQRRPHVRVALIGRVPAAIGVGDRIIGAPVKATINLESRRVKKLYEVLGCTSPRRLACSPG